MRYIIIILVLVCALPMRSQKHQMTLDLQQVIAMATDSSLTAFRYKNMYLADYWTYRSYKAERLPSLSLNMTPTTYNRSYVERYNYETNKDEYREQQSYSASGSLLLSQNFDPVGGTFYVQTSLDYLRNIQDKDKQYTSVPFTIGYSHNMFGYNEFKWDRKIEPMKFEKAKLEYLYNTENISSLAVSYFFNLAQAQSQYQLAKEQAISCDSLLIIGERKYKIAAITKSDLLSLKLDVINASNTVKSAEVSVKRASMMLTSFLGIDRNTDLHLVLPGKPLKMVINPTLALEMMHKNSYMILEKMQSVTEAEMQLDQVNKTTRFNANVNASVGFNQQSHDLNSLYKKKPEQRDMVSLSIVVPLIDWGVGKGKRNNARNNLDAAKIDAEQKIMELEQDVIVTIDELQSRADLISSSEEALMLAEMVYKENKMRFQNGTCDITTLSQSQQRLLTAQNEYIESMQNYWSCYYDLRKQTLYDFQMNVSLSEIFDFNNLR